MGGAVDLGSDLARRLHRVFRVHLGVGDAFVAVIEQRFAVADAILLHVVLDGAGDAERAVVDGGFEPLQEREAEELQQGPFGFRLGLDEVIGVLAAIDRKREVGYGYPLDDLADLPLVREGFAVLERDGRLSEGGNGERKSDREDQQILFHRSVHHQPRKTAFAIRMRVAATMPIAA